MTNKSVAPSWASPKSLSLGKEAVLFHCGLGPGDAIGHKRVYSQEVVACLQEIGRSLQSKMKRSKNWSAQELSLYAVELLEKEPRFNAGRGAKLQRDGHARLSAAVMRGKDQRMAGVSNLEATIHTSRIAASLLDQHDRCLTGFLATQYAREMGVPFESPETPERIAEWKERMEGYTGTVGSVSIDSNRDLFAATSTGGRGFERPGRVSDSCTPAGNFATRFGAVSCTGVGEDILDSGLAVAILTRLEDGMTLQESSLRSFFRFHNKRFGMIALDYRGEALVHATQGTLGFGVVTKDQVKVGLTSHDWQKCFS